MKKKSQFNLDIWMNMSINSLSPLSLSSLSLSSLFSLPKATTYSISLNIKDLSPLRLNNK